MSPAVQETDVIDVIGNFGRFQKEVMVLLGLRSLILPVVFFLIHVTSSNVDHWCSPGATIRNMSVQDWKECCVPKSSGGFSQCQRYDVTSNFSIGNDSVVQCREWEYVEKQTSIRAEWNLVCDRKWLLSLLYSTFYFGNLISFPIVGYLADRFGRKPVVLIGWLGVSVTSCAVAFSNSFTMILASRFFSGVMYTFVLSPTVTLFVEVCGKQERALTTLFTGGIWSVGTTFLTILSMYLPNWRLVALLGCLSLPTGILFWKFFPESPRWLIVCKKRDKAKEVLELATRKNGIKIHDIESVMKALGNKHKMEQHSQHQMTLKDILRNKMLLYVYSVIMLSSFTCRLIVAGFSLSLEALGGDYNTNFLITTGLTLLAALFSFIYLYKITKRRLTLLVAYTITGVVFLLTTAINEDLLWLRITVAMFARFLNSLILEALPLLVYEVFPTRIRNMAINIFLTAGRFGSLTSSSTGLLAETYGANASMFLFGVLALFIAGCYYFVPEIDNTNLPDTFEETSRVNHFGWREMLKGRGPYWIEWGPEKHFLPHCSRLSKPLHVPTWYLTVC